MTGKTAILGVSTAAFSNFTSTRVAPYSFGARTRFFLQKMDRPRKGMTRKLLKKQSFSEFGVALAGIGSGDFIKYFQNTIRYGQFRTFFLLAKNALLPSWDHTLEFYSILPRDGSFCFRFWKMHSDPRQPPVH